MQGSAWPARPRRRPLRASLVGTDPLGAASDEDWETAAGAEPLDWDVLFASTGLFGIEIGAAATALTGQPVELRGYMTPPMLAESDYFVLSRSPVPNCPFCVPMASWPDDIVVVHLRVLGVDVEHSAQEVVVRGLLELGEAAGPIPGLTSHARLLRGFWRPAA